MLILVLIPNIKLKFKKMHLPQLCLKLHPCCWLLYFCYIENERRLYSSEFNFYSKFLEKSLDNIFVNYVFFRTCSKHWSGSFCPFWWSWWTTLWPTCSGSSSEKLHSSNSARRKPGRDLSVERWVITYEQRTYFCQIWRKLFKRQEVYWKTIGNIVHRCEWLKYGHRCTTLFGGF